MRDTRVHLNNFYICEATNQVINVTPFVDRARKEEWKELSIKLSKWDVEAAACLDIPLYSAIFPSARARKNGKRERILHE